MTATQNNDNAGVTGSSEARTLQPLFVRMSFANRGKNNRLNIFMESQRHVSGDPVATINLRNGQAEQYASLFAAAPEIIEALKDYLQAGSKEARRLASIKAKAAIAKAQPSI